MDKEGNNIVIGALDYTNRYKGYVKVYKKISNNWNNSNSIFKFDDNSKIQGANNYDYYGSSVDITNNIDITSNIKNSIIIGSKNNDNGGTNSGLIQIYELDNTTDASNGILNKIGEERIGEDRYNYFGHNVSISKQINTYNTIVLIGAYGNLKFTGYAKVFQIEDISNKGVKIY